MQKVLDMSMEQFFTIGLVQNDPVFGIARNNVRNVPDPLPIAGQLWFPAPYTAQMYFEGGAQPALISRRGCSWATELRADQAERPGFPAACDGVRVAPRASEQHPG